MKKKLLIGTAVSAVFLYLAVKDVEWNGLSEIIKHTQIGFLFLAIVATMLGVYARAYRWKFLIAPIRSVSTYRLFVATMIGFMANNLLPARLGELVRVYALSRSEDLSKSAVFATIVYERICDVFTLLALLWIVLLNTTGPAWLRTGGVWLLAFNIALLVLLIAIKRNREGFMSAIDTFSERIPTKIRRAFHKAASSFVLGLESVAQPSKLLPLAITSILVWGFAVCGLYFTLEALDLKLPPMAGVVLVVVVSLGAMLPSAPAFLGTIQYACIVALGIYGIAKTEALAYSLLYHATQFFPITILGLFYSSRIGLGLKDMSRTTSNS